MNSDERWRIVKDLFERALEQEPGDLDAWLDRAGATDPQVRAEVLSLLRHHTAAGSFLLEPIADRAPGLLDDAPPLEPGQVVGKYTIVREIGRGGMGIVYLATEHPLKRRVALKALAPQLARDPSYRVRFRREAQAASNLTDPGICTVYAFEEIDENLYIASEYLEGRTLRQEIESGPRPPAETVGRTARDFATALACAHRQGITHRDLKPENVMRTGDGRLKILDFGLALVEPGAAGLGTMSGHATQPNTFMGTPAYMAPEQVNGQRADARTDVFAFGVLLHEYASGAHPFQAEGVFAVMARILESEPPPLERRRPDLPPALAAVIHRCLRKQAADRFQSAADIVGALDHVDPARPPGPVTAWWRTHQLAVIALYFVASTLAWQIKEWQPGVTMAVFFATGIAATVGGVFRGHLLFMERVTGKGMEAERRRASIATLVSDLTVALALAIDGAMLAAGRPVPAILTIALGLGVAIARLVVEPATTAATFAEPEPD